jgi:diaminopropionate ammonia-lyase
VVAVEPVASNGVQRSIESGARAAVADRFTTMAGLRSQHVSRAAWPILRAGLDAAVSITDDNASAAMRLLTGVGIRTGESGAAGLAGAIDACANPDARDRLHIDASTTIAIINTEGITDSVSFRRIAEDRGDHHW